MTKSKLTGIKELSIPIGIIASIIGAAIGYGQQVSELKNTKEIVIEVKANIKEENKSMTEKIETIKDSIQENTEVNVRQTVILDNISRRLEKLDDK